MNQGGHRQRDTASPPGTLSGSTYDGCGTGPLRLLVTGGAGYIGSVVTALLVEAGHEVTVFDNLSTGTETALHEGARLVKGDLLDLRLLGHILADGYDGVLHFAGLSLVEESVAHPERYYRTNVCGTLNLLDAMRDAGVPRLVFSSTAAVYGECEEIPIPEAAPARPSNPYGGSKLAADGMIGAEAAAHGTAAVSLRYFNVAGASGRFGGIYGPKTQLIPLVLAAAAGRRDSLYVYWTDYPTPDGTAIRDYIHVEDLARAHLLALGAAEPGTHEIYNLGNGSGYSVREVIEAARLVTGREVEAIEAPRRAGDPPVVVASSKKIRAELGWAPRKPELSEMISDAWAWMQTYSYARDPEPRPRPKGRM